MRKILFITLLCITAISITSCKTKSEGKMLVDKYEHAVERCYPITPTSTIAVDDAYRDIENFGIQNLADEDVKRLLQIRKKYSEDLEEARNAFNDESDVYNFLYGKSSYAAWTGTVYFKGQRVYSDTGRFINLCFVDNFSKDYATIHVTLDEYSAPFYYKVDRRKGEVIYLGKKKY